MASADQRADARGGLEPGADGQLARLLDDDLLERAQPLLVDKEPLRRDADLAGVAEPRRYGSLRDRLDVDVGKHQHGRVASELEREPRHRAGRTVHQQLADGDGTGEAELAQIR